MSRFSFVHRLVLIGFVVAVTAGVVIAASQRSSGQNTPTPQREKAAELVPELKLTKLTSAAPVAGCKLRKRRSRIRGWRSATGPTWRRSDGGNCRRWWSCAGVAG